MFLTPSKRHLLWAGVGIFFIEPIVNIYRQMMMFWDLATAAVNVILKVKRFPCRHVWQADDDLKAICTRSDGSVMPPAPD